MTDSEVFIEVSITLPKDHSLDLATRLDNQVLTSLSGYYEVLYEEGQQTEQAVFKLYFPANYTSASAEVEALLVTLEIPDYSVEQSSINRLGYMEAYKEHYEPLRLSTRFAVIPNWHKASQIEQDFAKQFESEYLPLYLDPGLAFGTGRHATTQMMIEWIDSQDWHNLRLLDAGCGSGILSLAALKKGAAHATAFDIDRNAVNATVENLIENQIPENKYSVFEGGWDLPQLQNIQFDVILANITMNIFVEYRKIINQIQSNRLVVSGVLQEMKERFIE
ncbi:MAG: 50S ribosomal protein L11 methyltransferase, partial [Leptonema sp. (in: Bacteria)]|nr:50S ribosomal protein L11 methyltransferase [Leptonema sp. (in: bacteria)]